LEKEILETLTPLFNETQFAIGIERKGTLESRANNSGILLLTNVSAFNAHQKNNDQLADIIRTQITNL